MSARKADRWRSNTYWRDLDGHHLAVEWTGATWTWTVWRHGRSAFVAAGRADTEKKAKLAATRWLKRELRRAGK